MKTIAFRDHLDIYWKLFEEFNSNSRVISLKRANNDFREYLWINHKIQITNYDPDSWHYESLVFNSEQDYFLFLMRYS